MQKIISVWTKTITHQVSIAYKNGAHVITFEARTPFDPVNETVRSSDPVERT